MPQSMRNLGNAGIIAATLYEYDGSWEDFANELSEVVPAGSFVVVLFNDDPNEFGYEVESWDAS